ncbi:MAG TPA: hypothetical protein DCY79_06215 [Planctomycetaceae bacterium]|nr:hypothetical protein [Planctomycetaceae bacterium]
MRAFACSFLLGVFATTAVASATDYCVVVRAGTYRQPAWQAVADALIKKHDGKLLQYAKDPQEVLGALRDLHPRYTCFVTPHPQAGRQLVADIHQLTRALDDDPYTDTLWAILTGYDASNALAIAQYNQPLVVKKVASGTEVALEMCEQGLWYDELVKHKLVRKEKGQAAKLLEGPGDTTAALVETLNRYQPDLFVTSGHATERNWQIGFRYRNGYFKSAAGQMFGEDTQKQRIDVESDNPKVYLPIGNCLMGHIDGPDAMALAWMNDVGVKQMLGYTVPTWFGYGGWGVLDYFVEQPGRYTLTEAFFANHHALIHALENNPRDRRGLAFDRDVVAFYGDPKWSARLATGNRAYEQTLKIDGDEYTFHVEPRRGSDSFKPVNTNGAQRGWRPIVQFLPHRVTQVRLTQGQELHAVVTDDFILIPNPRECDPQRDYTIKFTAQLAP